LIFRESRKTDFVVVKKTLPTGLNNGMASKKVLQCEWNVSGLHKKNCGKI